MVPGGKATHGYTNNFLALGRLTPILDESNKTTAAFPRKIRVTMPWVLFAFVIATGAPSLACGEGWDYEGMQEPPFGLAAVVLNHGVVAKTVYIGRNGTWFGRPVDGHSVFEGASLGKTLASWLALRMVAEGRLELDRPLSGYMGAESEGLSLSANLSQVAEFSDTRDDIENCVPCRHLSRGGGRLPHLRSCPLAAGKTRPIR